MPTSGTVDLIPHFAEVVPLWTICHLLGLPVEDAHRFAAWAKLFARLLDGPRSSRDRRRSDAAVAQMTAYFRQRIGSGPTAERTLIDELVRRCPAELSERDVVATCEMLLLGGFATTVNLIGNSLFRVLSAGGSLSPPDHLPSVVEESLRYDSPVQYTVRVAKRDAELAGQLVAARTPIIVLLAGANRDPQVFAEPDRFLPGRPNAHQHLAFGAGPHYCIGASMSSREVSLALRQLFQRYPNMRLAGSQERLNSRVLRGFSRLDVTLA
ncbi:cytochrome P450 [Kribbella italica]|uniref:Cytochrome P450 n=1 Tax=Kribbella italica TaxID=1540520 RepID=A0A7W9JGX4_9ACTN|nr:cytochrome P450 [Kribbella italica]MBB5841615.1 cytochrome P450 [Kribbella italica]